MNFTHRKLLFHLIVLYFLNITDAVITLIAVSFLKIGQELNPAMRTLIELSPILFFVFKVLLMTLVGIAIWRTRDSKSIRVITYILMLLYVFVVSSNVFMTLFALGLGVK